MRRSLIPTVLVLCITMAPARAQQAAEPSAGSSHHRGRRTSRHRGLPEACEPTSATALAEQP